MAPPDLESAAAPEGPSSSSSASQSADQPSTTRKSYFKLFTSGYWKKRRADHRPPPLKTPVNKQGQELQWQGPRHRKTAAEQAIVDAERAQHQHPELHRPKRRNLGARFFTPQQVGPACISCLHRLLHSVQCLAGTVTPSRCASSHSCSIRCTAHLGQPAGQAKGLHLRQDPWQDWVGRKGTGLLHHWRAVLQLGCW